MTIETYMSGGLWRVRRQGAVRDMSAHIDRRTALAKGRQAALDDRTDLVAFDERGAEALHEIYR